MTTPTKQNKADMARALDTAARALSDAPDDGFPDSFLDEVTSAWVVVQRVRELFRKEYTKQ